MQSRHVWPRAPAFVLLLAAIAAACGITTPTTVPPTPTPNEPSPTPTPTAFPSDDDFANLIRAATRGMNPAGEGELDALWRWILDDEMGGIEATYDRPAGLVSYRPGERPATPCARGLFARDFAQNARYCRQDATIYYDESWLRDYRAKAGNFAPLAILAHEWGHHIQALTGKRLDGDTWPLQLELQADCYAGVFLGSREKVKDGVYTLGVADLTSGLATFFDLGNRDYDASHWMGDREHGSQLQRMMAFGTGFLGSIGDAGPFGEVSAYYPWCHGYAEFEPGDVATIGAYRLIMPPGASVATEGDNYSIAPYDALDRSSSGIVLAWFEGVTDPEAIAAASAGRFPGWTILIPPGDLGPLPTSVGDLTYFYFEGAAEPIRSGFYGVLPATAHGTLGILVHRDEAPIRELSDPRVALLARDMADFGQIANRLCAPGKSDVPGTDEFSVACAAAQ